MTIAAIDIGTNTVLLLIARVESGGGITTLVSEQRIPRLGKGVEGRRRLHPDAMERTVAAVAECRSVIAPYSPAVVAVTGTSALRDAENREEFARLLRDGTGYALEVISGRDEALLSFRGTLSGFPPGLRATLLDIGGGSTELTVGTMGGIDESMSADVGALRLTERYLHHDPPAPQELADARNAISEALEPADRFPFHGSELIGIAGTVTSLAHLALRKSDFDPSILQGARLSRSTVEELTATLTQLPVSRIRALSAVLEGRSDIITAGALILREVMHRFGFRECTVSERGLRYGVVLREWEKRQAAI